jgi:chromosome segregation ATPase
MMSDLTPEREAELHEEVQHGSVSIDEDEILALLNALRDERIARQHKSELAAENLRRAEQAEAERDDLARQVGEHAKEASKWRVWREQDARHISDRDKALADMTRQRDEAARLGEKHFATLNRLTRELSDLRARIEALLDELMTVSTERHGVGQTCEPGSTSVMRCTRPRRAT